MQQEEPRRSFKDFRDKHEQSGDGNRLRTYGIIIGAIILVAVVLFIVRSVVLGGNNETPEGDVVVAVNETPEATVTDLLFATDFPTSLPTNTIQATATASSTVTTQVPTQTPTLEPPTSIPTQATNTPIAPSVTPTPILATCICNPENAAFFGSPRAGSAQIGVYISPGEVLTVLGRDSLGIWILVENEDGEIGWVTASYFEIDEPVDSLKIVDVIVTREGSPVTTTVLPSTTLVAYWNETSKASNQDGTWYTILSVRVPEDGSYQFQVANLNVDFSATSEISDGYRRYEVRVSGMSCSGSLVNNLTVIRNGQSIEVRNQHDNAPGAIFVEAPTDC